MRKFALIFFLAAGLALVCGPATAADEPRVDGILYDAAHPEESAAIVNGNVVKMGESAGAYRIIGITPDSVRLRNSDTGQERELRPAAKPVSSRPPAAPPAPIAATEKATDVSGFPKFDFNPAGILDAARQTQALVHLRNIHTAATAYLSENYSAELTLPKLVSEMQLSADLADGQSGPYKFRVVKSPEGGAVAYADPADPKSTLLRFCVDENGQVHSEKGRAATPSSPLYTP